MIDQMIPALIAIAQQYNPAYVFTRRTDNNINCGSFHNTADSVWDAVDYKSPVFDFCKGYELPHESIIEFSVDCCPVNHFTYFPTRTVRRTYNMQSTYIVTVRDDVTDDAIDGNYAFDVVFYDPLEAKECAVKLSAYLIDNIDKLDYSKFC